ncbi:hypothetical protein HN419_05155 [Candidatus Woesearchaeota archaeon]|jgi:hypothetical protein|nr:hypothetical protein [Candidatus Woesearchaeota archaeon]MBT3537741.1 hypothetical protein [Candidatus Woesearchaeota archaeon]MBT4697872.1 hypothetical protein [Candidatus Woesearchaeota archaeon]MBT4717468.1 hypothetical protein [Candidatus Woesearchaeota archaeon]MBT7105410.1 hypothetical protein [Candidatus Woesearchaeota archaeon]
MKSRLAVAVVLLAAVIALASMNYPSKSIIIVCNEPYIMYGDGCCLDTNYNNVCDDREATSKPSSYEIQHEIYDEVLEEPVVEFVEVPLEEEPETMAQPAAFSTPTCGDGVCDDRSSFFQDYKVMCDEITCAVNDVITENTFSCPRDCGYKCGERTNFYVGECKRSDSLLVLELSNVGKNPIVGFSFVYTTYNTKDEYTSTSYSIHSYAIEDFKENVGYETMSYLLKPGDKRDFTFQKAMWEAELGDRLSQIQIIPRILSEDEIVDCSNQRVVFKLDKC